MGQRRPEYSITLSWGELRPHGAVSNSERHKEESHAIPTIRSKTAVLSIATAGLSALFAQGAAAIEPTSNVIEYYNASLNHFFDTA
jgi:hypothetical protein